MKNKFTAKRLPMYANPSPWNRILPEQPPGQTLTENVTCDFAIVGGGFAGLSAARRLSQLNPGASIVLLDAMRIAEGATGRNLGFMIDVPHELTSDDYTSENVAADVKMTAMNRSAIAFAKDAVEEYGVSPDFFDPVGCYSAAATDVGIRGNRGFTSQLEKLGEPYETLDAQGMLELTGSHYYKSGVYTPGTVMLQPAGYARGFAAGLSSTVRIFENSPVSAFKRTGSAWTLETSKGNVTAGKIILANNGHLESFGFQRGRLMHLFLFGCMTRKLSESEQKTLGGRPRWGMTPADPLGATVRRIDASLGGPRLIIRSGVEFQPNMVASEWQHNRCMKVMRRKFDDRFPQFAGMDFEHVWNGHLCLSTNSVSVAKEIETGVFSACVQNGLGAARGTLTGIAAAEMASGAPGPIAQFFMAEDDPKRLPPPPISTIGANAVIMWKEWKARRE